MKEEKIKEAAKEYVKNFAPSVKSARGLGFVDGAKWQQERMYSEEDLREAFRQGENNVGYNSKYGYTFKSTEKEWFEQFKKK